jgi:hypothetical protein
LVKLISNLPELKIIHSLNYVGLLVAKYWVRLRIPDQIVLQAW